MTTTSKVKSCSKPVVDFLSLIQKALKVIKGFTQKTIKVTTTQIINKCV